MSKEGIARGVCISAAYYGSHWTDWREAVVLIRLLSLGIRHSLQVYSQGINAMVTALYAALLGIFFSVLSARVIALRGVTPLRWLAFNNYGEKALERSVRAHGNFVEYVPMILVMMYLAEVGDLSDMRLHITGLLLLVGRLMHGICFGFMEFNMPLRVGGTVLTLAALVNISISLLIVSI